MAARAVPPLIPPDSADAADPYGATRTSGTAAHGLTAGGECGAAPVDVSLAAGAGRRDILGAGWCDAEATATWTG